MHLQTGTEIILCRDKEADWEKLCAKYEKDYVIKGILSDYYEGEKKLSLEQLDRDEILILTGRDWKESSEFYETLGYIPWKNLYPEWVFSFMQEGYFKFEAVKRYTQNNAKRIGEIFAYISKYKKIAVVYGNCQSLFLARILENTDVIHREYIFCELEYIQNMKEEAENGFDAEYMKYIALFIYQNVRKDNVFSEKLATEEAVLRTLSPSALRVSVPFVYFNAYFPQYIRNVRNDDTRRGEGHTPYGDGKIQELAEQGLSVRQITAQLESEDLFSEEELKENLERTSEALREREQKCDIRILDFILRHYKTEYLFYSPPHPTNVCLKEVAERILKFLGYSRYHIHMDDVPENDTVEMYIYPSVRRKLGLTFPKRKFCFHRDLGGEDTIQEYVKKYITYNFPEFSESMNREFRTINVSHLLQVNTELVSDRRPNVLTLNGRCLHLGCYMTVMRDNPKGTIFRISQRYAPEYSYVTAVIPVGKTGEGAYPCIVNTNGEFTTNTNLKKGTVVIIDTTWTMR